MAGKKPVEQVAVGPLRVFHRGDQPPPLLDLQRDRLARRVLLRHVLAPGREQIAPSEEGDLVRADLGQHDPGAPPVIAERLHRDLGPVAFRGATVDQDGVDAVVAVAEDVGLYRQRPAGDRLGGEPAAVDLRVLAILQRDGRLVDFLRENLDGYSDAQIDAFLDSKTEKKRIYAVAEDYLTRNGAKKDDPESFCRIGRDEIAKNTIIGSLLVAK